MIRLILLDEQAPAGLVGPREFGERVRGDPMLNLVYRNCGGGGQTEKLMEGDRQIDGGREGKWLKGNHIYLR